VSEEETVVIIHPTSSSEAVTFYIGDVTLHSAYNSQSGQSPSHSTQ